jgi:Kef-type K+ transport system membrane component KefB
LGYLAMLAGAVVAFLFIRAHGMGLGAPAPSGASGFVAAAKPHAGADTLLHVLVALIVVIVAARGLGALFARLHQPAVIGEVVAGILLGPSLLGRIAPEVSAYVLPASVAPFLSVIAQVGVILYMFLVGLELDTGLLKKRTHASIAVSHASILTPFLLGSALAIFLYPKLSTSDVPFTVFALFMGVSMSVTAFPVLARILTDRKMQKSRLGTIALACAAVDDVTAWCLLAFVVSMAKAQPGHVFLTVGLTGAYIAIMLLVVRPGVAWFVRWHDSRGDLPQSALAVVFVGLLLSSLATESIGIHALFGAFLLGAMVPADSRLAQQVIARLEDIVVVLLLPAFFAFTGMRTQIGLVSGGEQWLMCGAIIVCASVGKFGGSTVAARLTGLDWQQSAALGALMNTRGLMELIVLNVGLDLGVLSPTLFAMMVIMALVTTFATTPVLHLLTARGGREDLLENGATSRP